MRTGDDNLVVAETDIAFPVGTNLWLSFWTSDGVPGFQQGHYMAVYAGFGE